MKYPRYPAYKDSGFEWIGEIPEHWDLIPLKWTITIMKGKVPKNIETDASETKDYLPYLSMEFLRGETSKQWIRVDNSTFVVNEGETLLLWDGSNAGEFIKSRRGILSSTVALIHSNNVNHNFLFYFCKAAEHKLKELTVGMGIPHVDGDLLKSLSMPFPSNEEQVSIGNVLDRKMTIIDSLILKEQQIINFLREKRQAIITNAVTKGLDLNGRMKDSGVEWIGEIPEHWKVIKLKSASIFNPPKSEIKSYSGETPVSFFPMESIGDDGKLEHLYFRPISEVINGYTYFKNGDVVIAKITPCFENGKGALIEGMKSELGFGTTELIVIRPLPILTKSFLYFLTITGLFRNLGEGAMQGASGQKRVPEKFVTNFKFGLPPLGEQIQISNYVKVNIHKIDDLISKQQKMIEFLNEYKTSLITHAVTGKIDVRGFTVPTDSKSA